MCRNGIDTFRKDNLILDSVFVNGRPRPVIFEDMKQRIARGDIGAERKEAIDVSLFSTTLGNS